MSYRKFKADHLFTGYRILDHHSVLVTREDGRIEGIVDSSDAGDGVESFRGILSPGFINCHCHLELSHLKGLIPEKTGLTDFVFSVVTRRHFPAEEIQSAIDRAESEMLDQGIVGVGDICNNTSSLLQKKGERLSYYNFIELLSPRNQLAMAPHAPYSVSEELWQMLIPFFKGKTISMHNQETNAEDEFFKEGKGDLNRMYARMNIDNSFFRPSGKSSFQTVFPMLGRAKNVLLVHNTFTKQEDIELVKNAGAPETAFYFCLCVNANLYIENSLPPLELFRKNNCQLVLGTDSLASNHQLSILEEIKTILQHFPGLPIAEPLQWATLNGARSLQMDQTAGSFEKGKYPGVILIENTEGLHIDRASGAKRIL
jgi:aminodeoxyfutalosine deaminase